MIRTLLMLTLAAGLLGGCVEREWTLRTEPAGALVYVSGELVGRSPVTIDFTWYGEYRVRFEKDGYETLETSVKMDPPIYEWLGIDFWSEIAPWTYYDRRETLHLLETRREVTEAELLDSAAEAKRRALEGVSIP